MPALEGLLFKAKNKESCFAGFSACGEPLSRHISFPPQYPRFAGADLAIIVFYFVQKIKNRLKLTLETVIIPYYRGTTQIDKCPLFHVLSYMPV
jgi:hypothetical protein